MKKKTPKKILKPKELSKKVLASVPEHTNHDLKRYIGAVSENFGHQVSAVAEQIVGIHEVLRSHTEMIGDIKEDMEIVKGNIEMLKFHLPRKVEYNEFEALEKRVRIVEAKVRRG